MYELAMLNETINTEARVFCSMDINTPEAKVQILNMLESPDFTLKEHINEIIEVQDVYCDVVEMTSEETGERYPGVRIFLIDTKGHSYVTTSKGVYSSVKNIFRILGTPEEWENPLKVKVKQITHNGKNILKLNIAG